MAYKLLYGQGLHLHSGIIELPSLSAITFSKEHRVYSKYAVEGWRYSQFQRRGGGAILPHDVHCHNMGKWQGQKRDKQGKELPKLPLPFREKYSLAKCIQPFQTSFRAHIAPPHRAASITHHIEENCPQLQWRGGGGEYVYRMYVSTKSILTIAMVTKIIEA